MRNIYIEIYFAFAIGIFLRHILPAYFRADCGTDSGTDDGTDDGTDSGTDSGTVHLTAWDLYSFPRIQRDTQKTLPELASESFC